MGWKLKIKTRGQEKHHQRQSLNLYKGTVSVISSDPLWKDGNDNGTQIKPLSDQSRGSYCDFMG